MTDTKIAILGVACSFLVAFFLWYHVEDELYRQRIEKGDWR